jgi:pantetheine-phosphate adenylyltransferase
LEKTALFPGSFDPFTIGHYDIVVRNLSLFDKIVIGIGKHSTKNYLFSPEERQAQIESVFKDLPTIEVQLYSGLTVDFCKNINASFILRGVRNSVDFDYEAAIARMNHSMEHSVETLLITSRPEFCAISSTIVREIYKSGGNVTQFLPPGMVI